MALNAYILKSSHFAENSGWPTILKLFLIPRQQSDQSEESHPEKDMRTRSQERIQPNEEETQDYRFSLRYS